MSELKRLSPQQSRRVNALIRKECCNCFDGNCILLDDGESCVCPQLISYSLLCKWFRAAVLPLDKLLLRSFTRARTNGVVPYAAPPLLPHQTMSNTAPIAESTLPAGKPPSV